MKMVLPMSAAVLSTAVVVLASAQIYPQLPAVAYHYPYQNPPVLYPYYSPVQHKQVQNSTNSTYLLRGNDFMLGAPSRREKTLLHTTIFKRPGVWSTYATKEITFPPRGSSIRANITRIHAVDRARNGTGAFVKLIRGGIGQQNVTLLFQSQKYRPINFTLDIFGYLK